SYSIVFYRIISFHKIVNSLCFVVCVNTMSESEFTRAALGEAARIGDLYDARTDKFSSISVFNQSVLPFVDKQDAHFSDVQLIQSCSLSDKFSKLDVSGELQASILCGLVSLKGS